MKQKLLSALIVSAFAGVATTASAGVIQASYKNFAAEAFGADIAMIAPTIGYSLALPLTGTVGNPNTFTVTYTLTAGEWDATNLPGATLVSVNNTDFVDSATNGVIDAADKRKLTFTFTLNNGVTFPTNSTIVLGSNALALSLNNPATGGHVPATNGDGAILKVYTELQKPALVDKYCAPTTANIGVTIGLANNAGAAFDSSLPSALNTTPILESGVATATTVKAGSALGATVATNESSRVDVLVGSLGTLFTVNETVAVDDVTDLTAPAKRVINLGSVAVGNRASLYDIDGATIYSVTDADWGAAASGDGGISHNGLDLKVSGLFIAGGAVVANTAADCAVGTNLAAAATFNASRTEASLSITKAALDTVAAAGGKRTVYLCYTVPGTGVIPTSQFALTSGSLKRQAASNELATPICPAALYNLTANGVRVDVRNYIPAIVEAPSGGWKNVVRVINTDESQPSVDVYGTALLRDGTIGATAVIAAGMKPREVRYLFAADTTQNGVVVKGIDTLLNAAATATAKTYGNDDLAANARLRITAASSSIRVQNYHYNPATGNFFETSSAQGDEGPDYAKARDVTNK